jgi:hypothetical protein
MQSVIPNLTTSKRRSTLDYTKCLNSIQSNLAANQCQVKNNVVLNDRFRADIVAERVYLSNGLVVQITFVTKFNNAQLQDFIAIKQAQLEYLRRTHWFSSLRGLSFNYSIVNCVATDAAHPGLLKAVGNCPLVERGWVELPVVFESKWMQATYFKGKTNISQLADMQALTAACIEGIRPNASTNLLPKAVRV